MLQDFKDEFERYKITGDRAIEQTSETWINQKLGETTNSMAIIVRHLSGEMISRFTDFLKTDGEKRNRNRDAEFHDIEYEYDEMMEYWTKGWAALDKAMAKLTEEDMTKIVTIRGKQLTVHEALARQVAHVAYHVGQIVTMSRLLVDEEWEWITIPRGKSQLYNVNPKFEKRPL
ncbi:MAG: DUF1572 family protein [Blastocatellia bacterium]